MSVSHQTSAPRCPVVFLLDVDNTLLDNDRVTADLRDYLTHEIDAGCAEQYFTMFQRLRVELGYADYLGALQRCRVAHPHDPRLLAVSSFLLGYPFSDRLFPGSIDVLAHLATFGPTVILSDGDVVFQPRKIERSGLGDAVGGRILAAVKAIWKKRVTTVFPRQGHYAHQPDVESYPRPDITIERIRELLDHDLPALGQTTRPREKP